MARRATGNFQWLECVRQRNSNRWKFRAGAVAWNFVARILVAHEKLGMTFNQWEMRMKMKYIAVCLLVLGLSTGLTASAEEPVVEKKEERAKAPPPKKQVEVASTNATFAKMAKTEAAYTAALDAHDVAGAKAKEGAEGAFKGTVSGLYERPGLLIVNFDKDYKKAVCAVLKGKAFALFPDMQTLVGKEIVVVGKFVLHNDRPEIVLEAPEQIKLAE